MRASHCYLIVNLVFNIFEVLTLLFIGGLSSNPCFRMGVEFRILPTNLEVLLLPLDALQLLHVKKLHALSAATIRAEI